MNVQKGSPRFACEAGVIHLALPLLILLAAGAVVFLMITQGILKIPSKLIPSLPTKKDPTVSLQTQYQNPFDKKAQYVNPFAGYKNPFDSLK